MPRLVTLPIFILISKLAFSQTLDGASTFNFLKLSNTPRLTAAGGIHLSSSANDVGMGAHNPSLLTNDMNGNLGAVFNRFAGQSNFYHLFGAYHHEEWQTAFSGSINYFSYGSIMATDASGNILGELNPADGFVQVGASRQYLSKWRYGLNLKFIFSDYGEYNSNGIAADVGISYEDTAKRLTASVLLRNAGMQFTSYGENREELPFDLQAGVSIGLRDAPMIFSLTAHHLHVFDIFYDDTSFAQEIGFAGGRTKSAIKNLFRHFVLAMEARPIPQLEFLLGYNHLLREELSVPGGSNGLNGFSIGAGLLLKKWQIRFARSSYVSGAGYSQFGVNFRLN